MFVTVEFHVYIQAVWALVCVVTNYLVRRYDDILFCAKAWGL